MSEARRLLRIFENLRSADDLMEYWARLNRNPRKEAARMFPDKPLGYIQAAKDISRYCSNLSTAIRFPKSIVPAGDHPGEMGSYADIAERAYDRLPDYAKRWVVQHIGMVGDYGVETPLNSKKRTIDRLNGLFGDE